MRSRGSARSLGQPLERRERLRAVVRAGAPQPVVGHDRAGLGEADGERLGRPARVEPERVVLGVDPVEQRLAGGLRLHVLEGGEDRVGEDALVLLALVAAERIGRRVGHEVAQDLHQVVRRDSAQGSALARTWSARARTEKLGRRRARRSAASGRLARGEAGDDLDRHERAACVGPSSTTSARRATSASSSPTSGVQSSSAKSASARSASPARATSTSRSAVSG